MSFYIFTGCEYTCIKKTEWLTEIITYIRQKLPEIQRITSYGRADTLCRITQEQFYQLKSAGLDRIHSGFETGSDDVFTTNWKGNNLKNNKLMVEKAKKAGIELSIYFMPGAGGKKYSEKMLLKQQM